MNQPPDGNTPIPQVNITDPHEPSIEERLRTPTTSGIYSHAGIELCREAAEFIENIKADAAFLRNDFKMELEARKLMTRAVDEENQRLRDYCSDVERNRDELYHENERLRQTIEEATRRLAVVEADLNSRLEVLQAMVREQMDRGQ